jgi:hypothetical protein
MIYPDKYFSTEVIPQFMGRISAWENKNIHRDIGTIKILKEPYSQPIITRNYSDKIPVYESPIDGLYVACMAQIYPEDRGTNYAVKQGVESVKLLN